MKCLVVLAVLSPLLVGCGGGELTLSEKVAEVRAKTTEICSYLPTVNSVAAMISAANPAVVTVGAIAQAICNAVTNPQQSLLKSECPTVNGVCVEGEFIDPKKGD